MNEQNYYTDNQSYIPVLHSETAAITAPEVELFNGGHQLAGVALAGRTAHSRSQQSDTAVSHARAHLIASAPVVGALTVTSSGLVLLGWLLAGGPMLVWLGVDLLIVGIGSVIALTRSRRLSLEHSPAGVERRDIDARAQIAMYAIDRHCEMVERLKGGRD